MTRADDGSSGRSRMMRKSHVRFPEKGVATHWSFDQAPPGQFSFGATPYSTIIIGVWGSRQRKIRAVYQFFLYTSLGSVLMLLAIPLILLQTGTTDLQILLTIEFSEQGQIFLWIASFGLFRLSKCLWCQLYLVTRSPCRGIPRLDPSSWQEFLQNWESHRFLRFSIPMFPEATLCSTPFIYTPSAIAIIYTSLTTSRQIDLKKIIAYSPVAHMNLVTIGMSSRAAAVRSPIILKRTCEDYTRTGPHQVNLTSSSTKPTHSDGDTPH
ncbi:NADH:ubiquinone reductase (H(+)-translocating) protein [Dioscorea alata]|uniref:NADH:ubiquinone reductase (H(+)-translocating) protein n=1 Tax=Dioscorea alata TaxID=55571 RepID=A0ACB7UL57_DIOAL|nr:NADH:ubiquinone reductase (H(+)-translocating) protein [Dioscorea alata]